MVNEEIENVRKNGLNEEDFVRNKKRLYGEYITEYNSVEETARIVFTDYLKGLNSFDYLEVYDEITKEYVEKVLNEIFVTEKEVNVIVR